MVDCTEVLNSLKQLENEVLPAMIAEKLDKSAQIVENAAKVECPVDTGHLRASISHTVEGYKATIGTSVEYAAAVHEKTKPFLQNAADSKIQEVVNIFKELF